MSSSPPTDVLRERVRAFLAGALDRWPGLPDATEDDVRAALPDAAAAPALLLGQPATGYDLPATDGAAAGRVWTQQGVVTLVEARDPVVADDVLKALGPPEAVIPSGLGDTLDQLLWPARGLVLHRSRIDGRVVVAYGHEPSTVDVVAGSPLAFVSTERRPR